MSPGIDELAGVIDSLLAVDPHELTDAELHEFVTKLERQRHRLSAVAGTAISAWDQRSVWADNGAAGDGIHAGFALSGNGEDVVFSRPDGAGGVRAIDAVTFPALNTDESYGRVPDGVGDFQVLATPSPGATNPG